MAWLVPGRFQRWGKLNTTQRDSGVGSKGVSRPVCLGACVFFQKG